MSSNKSKKGLGTNAKWGIALVVEILILVIMGVVYAKVWVGQKFEKIQVVKVNEEEVNESINEGANEAQKGYTTIALFGIDARDSYSMAEGNRSDSIMIASINNETKDVKIVSLFRDTLLYVPGNDVTTKVTHAYAYGGPELAMMTLNANLDLEITQFVTVNFKALSMAIDGLGGIELDIDDDEIPMLNACISEQINVTGIYSDGIFSAGHYDVNGTQATAYARIRSTDQGDITRTERQREVVSKMISKAKKADIATLDAVVDDVFENVATNITKDEMYDIIKGLMKYNLKDTAGFPFGMTLADSAEKGSIIVPGTLETNVSALHLYLFGTENYSPSQKVKDLSGMIQGETGVGPLEITVNSFTVQE